MGLTPVYLKNKVAIAPDMNKTMSEGFAVATAYNPEHHFAVTGVVVKVPDELYCDTEEYARLDKKNRTVREGVRIREITQRSSPSKPHGMELKVGDRVLFKYENQIDREDTEVMNGVIIMPYVDVYCKIENGLPIPINGYILVELAEVQNHVLKTEDSKTVGTIKFMSEHPNKGYITDVNYTENIDAKVGDTIIFKKGFFRTLSFELYPEFDLKKDLVAIQRRDARAVKSV